MKAEDWAVELEKIRAYDMVVYLSELGHQPVRISRADYWFTSPLREERNHLISCPSLLLLSLYVNRLIKLVNKKGGVKSSLIFDEFPTINSYPGC